MTSENYILPKTENSVNRIISTISRFFEISALGFSIVYVIYTIVRIFIIPNMLILNLLFAFFTLFLTSLFFYESFSCKKIGKKIKLTFFILRRAVCCAITVVVFFDIFSGITNLVPCNIIFALFCGFGLFITVLGDIFTATVPRWTEEILTSFKADIDISGLASRSYGHFKESMKKNENIKEEGVKGVLFAGGTVALSSLRKLIHKKK